MDFLKELENYTEVKSFYFTFIFLLLSPNRFFAAKLLSFARRAYSDVLSVKKGGKTVNI